MRSCTCASAAVRRARLRRDSAQTVSMPLRFGQPNDDATVRVVRAEKPQHASVRPMGLADVDQLARCGRSPQARGLGGNHRGPPRSLDRAHSRLGRPGAAGGDRSRRDRAHARAPRCWRLGDGAARGGRRRAPGGARGPPEGDRSGLPARDARAPSAPIERACPEMDEGFVRALEAQVPWAEIAIDRFPVARASRDCADTGRKQELKRLTSAWPKAEYTGLQGAMWPFRKRPGDLKPPEWELLERVFTSSSKIEAAYHLREDLTERFERDDTKAGAKGAIRAWCKRVRQRGLAEFERVLGTIDRWLDESTHDFQGRQTSGCVEGFNNRVQGLKRRCDGIFDVGTLFQRLTLDWHGYQRFGHT